MKNIITLIALSFTMFINAQWIEDASCNKKASIIANQAIEYVFNLEYMAAFGSANSALLLDENCGCAKLTLAYISSANSTWGSRAKKLKEINTSDLTSEEKAWFDYMFDHTTIIAEDDPQLRMFHTMYKEGIIDPTKVTRLALENAASVSGTMLLTEAVVSNIKAAFFILFRRI